MLVLSRKVGQSTVIDGGITVTILTVEGQRVRLGITAPESVSIRREELTFDLPDGTKFVNESNQRPHGRPVPYVRKSR